MLDEQEAKAQLIAELRESQRKLSTLLANLPGMVYRRANNARGAIESVSDGCASVTGYRSSDLIHGAGGAYADLIHPEDQPRVRTTIEKALDESEMLEDGLQALRQAYAETRRLIAGVRSPILEQSGLEAALADLASSARKRSSRTVDFQSELPCNRLPPVLENAIYRIAQESLNNACQHSRSQKVLMTLVQDGDVIRLEVRDWGRGFDPAAVRQGMLGLEGIRERARLLDGTAVIDSQRRQGTTVRVTLPLPASVAARGCRLAGALRDGGPAR